MSRDYYQIFGLEKGYVIDLRELSSRYRQLQREFHPDRFAGSSQSELRLAVQSSALINQAFETLKSPVKRAEYLLSLAGQDSAGQQTITRDPEFLMQQMQLREELHTIDENGDQCRALEQLASRARDQLDNLTEGFSSSFTAGDYERATDVVARMHFFDKFLRDIRLREEQLDD